MYQSVIFTNNFEYLKKYIPEAIFSYQNLCIDFTTFVTDWDRYIYLLSSLKKDIFCFVYMYQVISISDFSCTTKRIIKINIPTMGGYNIVYRINNFSSLWQIPIYIWELFFNHWNKSGSKTQLFCKTVAVLPNLE